MRRLLLEPYLWIALLAGAVLLAHGERAGWFERPETAVAPAADGPPAGGEAEGAAPGPSFPGFRMVRTGSDPEPRAAARARRLREEAERAEAEAGRAAALIARVEAYRKQGPRAWRAESVYRLAMCALGGAAMLLFVRRLPRAAGRLPDALPAGPWTLLDVGRVLALWAFLFALGHAWTRPPALAGLAGDALLGAATDLVLAAAILLLARAHGAGLRALGLADEPVAAGPAAGVAAYFALWPLIEGARLATEAVLAARGEAMPAHPLYGVLLDFDTPLATRALLVVAAALLVPAVEEIGFRGVLLPALRRHAPRAAAVAASALLFALVHDPRHVAPLFVLGAGLALAYEATGSLAAPIALHVLFNSGEIARGLWLARGAG